MITDIELMQWIDKFGRWNVQEFVAQSGCLADVLTYLRAEKSFELAKATVFMTSDLVSFEKRTGFPLIAGEG